MHAPLAAMRSACPFVEWMTQVNAAAVQAEAEVLPLHAEILRLEAAIGDAVAPMAPALARERCDALAAEIMRRGLAALRARQSEGSVYAAGTLDELRRHAKRWRYDFDRFLDQQRDQRVDRHALWTIHQTYGTYKGLHGTTLDGAHALLQMCRCLRRMFFFLQRMMALRIDMPDTRYTDMKRVVEWCTTLGNVPPRRGGDTSGPIERNHQHYRRIRAFFDKIGELDQVKRVAAAASYLQCRPLFEHAMAAIAVDLSLGLPVDSQEAQPVLDKDMNSRDVFTEEERQALRRDVPD